MTLGAEAVALREARKRVVQMVARYVRLEYSIRSSAGRMAIDESRLTRKRGVEIDLETASEVEILDAINTASIRRAVYKPASVRIFKNVKGQRLHNVIAAREVAPIVRGKSKHGGSQHGDDAREWRATVGQKLARIVAAESDALITAEKIRLELRVMRNQLAAARSEVGRLRGARREARNLKRHAEDRAAELKSRESLFGDWLKSLVRTSAYRDGIDHLLAVCTESAEVEAYCFGD